MTCQLWCSEIGSVVQWIEFLLHAMLEYEALSFNFYFSDSFSSKEPATSSSHYTCLKDALSYQIHAHAEPWLSNINQEYPVMILCVFLLIHCFGLSVPFYQQSLSLPKSNEQRTNSESSLNFFSVQNHSLYSSQFLLQKNKQQNEWMQL